MTLESDAIFGNGMSLPGKEDISVLHDDQGFPYYKGSAFKGIFREELQNLIAWTKEESADLQCLLASLGIAGDDEISNKLRFHDFQISPRVKASVDIDNPQEILEAITYLRTFTALNEGGTAKAGTLRIARCIYAGVSFYGAIECDEEDRNGVEEVLPLIKWVGTMRNRGFGRVRITIVEKEEGKR